MRRPTGSIAAECILTPVGSKKMLATTVTGRGATLLARRVLILTMSGNYRQVWLAGIVAEDAVGSGYPENRPGHRRRASLVVLCY